FKCHLIQKQEKGWSSSFIFSFALPADLILPSAESCLHESILPLLPRYDRGSLYFSNCSKESSVLALFRYDLISHTLEQQSQGPFCFSPIRLGEKIYYGGKLATDPDDSSSPRMMINDDGALGIELPWF